jgi:cytochrome c553
VGRHWTRGLAILALTSIVSAGAPALADDDQSQAVLVGDATAGAAKSAVCGGCHMPDGNAVAPAWPKLAGQRADYIAKQLQDFRQGRRTDPIMSGMVLPLTKQDTLDLAAHFSRQRIRVGAGNPELAAIGERLYVEGRGEDGLAPCIGCHGPRGEGFSGSIPGGFPALGGQNKYYVVKQLRAFRSEARSNDWGGIMRFVAGALADEDIEALTEYLIGLQRSDD